VPLQRHFVRRRGQPSRQSGSEQERQHLLGGADDILVTPWRLVRRRFRRAATRKWRARLQHYRHCVSTIRSTVPHFLLPGRTFRAASIPLLPIPRATDCARLGSVGHRSGTRRWPRAVWTVFSDHDGDKPTRTPTSGVPEKVDLAMECEYWCGAGTGDAVCREVNANDNFLRCLRSGRRGRGDRLHRGRRLSHLRGAVQVTLNAGQKIAAGARTQIRAARTLPACPFEDGGDEGYERMESGGRQRGVAIGGAPTPAATARRITRSRSNISST
jgi:hypothetical protein